MNKSILDMDNLSDQDEKSEVFVRSQRKEFGKKEPVTHVLSPKMLPPITRTKVATYQVVRQFPKDPLLKSDPTGDDVLPYDVIIPGMYTIFDPFEKDLGKANKIVKNITRMGSEIHNGKIIPTEVVEDIVLPGGFLQVKQVNEFNLYVLMELHPLNGSNRFRNKSVPPAFKRIDLYNKSVATQEAMLDLADQASLEVKDMDIEMVIGIAAQMKLPTMGVQPKEIRLSLRQFAKQNPIEFYKVHRTSEQMFKINFLDALEFGFVEYLSDKKAYRFSDGNKPFFVHAAGEEPVSATVKYLMSDKGREVYNQILDYLNFWDN